MNINNITTLSMLKMAEKFISPQTKIAGAVLLRGGEANTIQISQDTGLTSKEVLDNGRHLVSRYILRKKSSKKENGRWNPSVWTLRPQKKEKVRQMVKDAYGEDILKNER